MAKLDWDDVRFFLALARSGSVRGAGAALGVSHSTVARRVEGLERHIDTRLFDRSRDGYQLTAAGRAMLATAEDVERRLADLSRDVVGADRRMAGPVHLTCWDPRVAELLLPALRTFTSSHPEISLHLSADTRSVSLTLREADVALRVLRPGSPPPEHLVGRRVAHMALAAYVAVAHAQACDPDLGASAARWLGFDDDAPQRAAIAGTAHAELPLWGRVDSLELMVAVTRAGLGIGMLPCYLGDADPQLQRLQRPHLNASADVWLLSHPDLRTTARLKALRACVVAAMDDLAPLFAGQPASPA